MMMKGYLRPKNEMVVDSLMAEVEEEEEEEERKSNGREGERGRPSSRFFSL